MKRLLGCAAAILIVLALPFCVSPNKGISSSVPFQLEAQAGHVIGNGLIECACGAVNCICDPGEQPTALKFDANQTKTSASNKGFPIKPVTSDNEAGLAMLIVALLFAVFLRMR